CMFLFFFSSRRRHTRFSRDWSSDVCSSDLESDFSARSLSFGASQDFFGDLTTLSFGYSRGDDTVRRSGDPLFEEEAMRQQYRVRSEERRVGKECRSRWWT